MAELLETKRYNQSKYAKFHNDIFSLLEKGYSVQKICDILNNENPEMNFKLNGIYSYIRLRKKNGNACIIEDISTEKKRVVQNTHFQPENLAGQQNQKRVSGGKATSAFFNAGLVSDPPTEKKKDDLFDNESKS